jgi:hypothetical protein
VLSNTLPYPSPTTARYRRAPIRHIDRLHTMKHYGVNDDRTITQSRWKEHMHRWDAYLHALLHRPRPKRISWTSVCVWRIEFLYQAHHQPDRATTCFTQLTYTHFLFILHERIAKTVEQQQTNPWNGRTPNRESNLEKSKARHVQQAKRVKIRRPAIHKPM